MNRVSNQLDRDSIRRIIAESSVSDYSGDTGFSNLSPSEKLDALAAMCLVVHDLKGKATTKAGMRGGAGKLES